MTSAADIMKLETEFWQSLVDGKPQKAGALLTGTATSVAMSGIHHFSPAEYVTLAEQGPAKVTGFSFSKEKVLFPVADVAIATYEVAQTIQMNGQSQEMVCLDTTTWVRRDGRWLAAVHTETCKQDQQGPSSPA